MVDVVHICENEGLLHIEAERDDVLDIAVHEFPHVLEAQLWPVQVLFIICELDDHHQPQSLLEPLSDDHRDCVAQVQVLAARPSSSIQVESLACFVIIQQLVEVPVRVEEPAADERVSWLSGQFF